MSLTIAKKTKKTARFTNILQSFDLFDYRLKLICISFPKVFPSANT